MCPCLYDVSLSGVLSYFPGRGSHHALVTNLGSWHVCINILVDPSYSGRLDFVFEKYYSRFTFPGDQNILNLFCCTLSTSHQNLMSIFLDLFGFTVLFIIPSAMLLSILTGVTYGGCRCPSSISLLLIGTYYCAFMYNPPYSASADDTITDFIALTKMNIVPLKRFPYLLIK